MALSSCRGYWFQVKTKAEDATIVYYTNGDAYAASWKVLLKQGVNLSLPGKYKCDIRYVYLPLQEYISYIKNITYCNGEFLNEYTGC